MFRVGKCLSTQNRAGNRRPSLNLNFQGGKLDSRVTFARSTTGTFVGSDGLIQTAAINTPRFDYDPVTLACKGLLIEEQRVNLLTYSDDFSNAAWTKTNATVTANAVAAPDGTTTADTLTASGANGTLIQDLGVVASAAKAAGLWLKRKTGTGNVDLTLNGGRNWTT